MSAENKTIVDRFYREVLNDRKLAVADELFSPNHMQHDPSTPGLPPGPRGIKELISVYHIGFPDAVWTVEEIIDAGDRIVVRWTGSGTQNGPLPGIPPTAKRVTVPGIWIHRLSDGKIAESWTVWDTLGMLQQLGRIPKDAAGRAAG